MYKIYINEIPLILKSSIDVVPEDYKIKDVLVVRYRGKARSLFNYIDMCEKNGNAKCVIIHHDDFEQLKADFLAIYTIVPAAGGLIENEKNEFLFIFRRGSWDLPKGKKEKGESKKQTAKREVIEETGIKSVEILKKLGTTNHTYKNKSGKRLIKKSHWYLMKTDDQKLVPQLEEDIEIAKWIKISDFEKNYKPVYKNINDVIDFYKKRNLKE